eukprot:TCALIF_10050-PA protein Name:"Similar to SPEN Msx2-interacting protein (Homo sapiens)" AED:0.40 eAED:0.40 QI:0/0/0/0.5/1/1/2/0/131
MVRETRHLWVGNLPENVKEERIKEYFKRRMPWRTVKPSQQSFQLLLSVTMRPTFVTPPPPRAINHQPSNPPSCVSIRQERTYKRNTASATQTTSPPLTTLWKNDYSAGLYYYWWDGYVDRAMEKTAVLPQG